MGTDGPPAPSNRRGAKGKGRGRGRPDAVKAPEPANDKESDEEVCWICASPIIHHSVSPCNHRTCHICSLRMRALYKTKDCAHCRTLSPFVIFTDDDSKRFEDYTDADISETDANVGIKYETTQIVEDTKLLLQFNCPDGDCTVACLSWPDLHRHVKTAHKRRMCNLCTRNKKVFTHEHELFTEKALDKHIKYGDDDPGAVDQSGFKGHPLCGFCDERFYGSDELFTHCREKHFTCFICDNIDPRNPKYYLNYEALEDHFRRDHFLCPDKECLEKKFQVFPTELDFKAHQLDVHGQTLSKDVRRDARTVDMSGFDFRSTYQERRPRERGRGRGRDPNAEPLPVSSAQPLRRDEQAFQRQMAVQSAQSVTTRTFGGQLTASASTAPSPASPASPARARQAPTSSLVAAATDSVGSLGLNDIASDSPQDQVRRMRHAAVIERATVLLKNDATKLNQFRLTLSSFRSDTISATALIESFFAVFAGTSSDDLGKLTREVADLYEDPAKATAIRSAFNDWRAMHENYPSLPGSGSASGSIPFGWAQVTSSRSSASRPAAPTSTAHVLRLKSASSQSSRASSNQSWGSAGSAAAGPAFPSLPSSARPAQRPTTTWVPSAGASAPPVSRAPAADSFPALPPAAKPQTTIFGYGRGMVRRDVGSPAPNAWAASSSESAAVEAADEGVSKKKKGKKVLVQWG